MVKVHNPRIAAGLTAILLLLTSLAACKKDGPQGGDGGVYILALSETNITLSQGASKVLTANYSPAGAIVLWESSDPQLLEVREGVVTAKGETGSATVTAKLVTLSDLFTPRATATCQVQVRTVYVGSIELPSALPLSMGTTYRLMPKIQPEDAQEAGLEYAVTQGSEYVSVSAEGELTPKDVTPAGVYATVTVTAKDAHHASATVKVSVGAKAIYPTAVSMNNFVEETSIGKDFYVSLDFTPSSANWKSFTVDSSNPAVATVAPRFDNAGFTVSPKAAGNVTITLTWESETSKDNKIQKSLTVHSGEPSIGWNSQMDLSLFSKGLIVGDNVPLLVDVSNLNNKKVIYSSSNESVATVSESGVVSAKKSGWVTITARAEANNRLSVSTGEFRVYGRPAKLYFSSSVDNGLFVRYGTSKSLNIIVQDASGSASRQDLLKASLSQGSGMNIALSQVTGTDKTELTFTGRRTSASSTIPGTVNVSVTDYPSLNRQFTLYDAMYDEYDIKPFDGLYCASNGMTVYDGGYRGSGYFSMSEPPAGAFRTKSNAIIVHVGDRPSAKSALGNLPGLPRRSQSPAAPIVHGLAVSKTNAGAAGKWWTVSAGAGDEVLNSSHYTGYWSGGKSDPMYVSTTNNDGYGYEITTAMMRYNSKLTSAGYTVLPVMAIKDNMPAAGPNNSGWYLPTSAEWAKMLSCLGAGMTPAETSQKLTQWITAMDSGSGIYTHINYWSCQEASVSSNTKAVYMTGASASGAGKTPDKTMDKTLTASTRPFLAF